MATTVTVSVRSIGVTLATAAAVLAAYFLGSAQAPSSTASAADTGTAATDTISMTGVGEATGIPDQLTFALDVHASAADVSTALDSANRTTHRVLAAVSGQDVARKDVQTTGLSINANYDYSGDGPAVITGYSVSEYMSVLVRELPTAGATISAAVGAGGNAVRLHDVRLKIGDEAKLLSEARAAAFAEAQDKAEQYAEASGRTLGEVSTVREASAGQSDSSSSLRTAAAADFSATSLPIRAGSADLHVTVSVVWSFA
ncbi:MAG: SIMPL domain-containing protein [Nocardioidaceae bacterium]